jgi:Zn-dependent protease with chaperone function
MMSVGDFLFQLLQPYFFYSLVFVPVALICVKLFLALSPAVSRRSQSLIYLFPLSIPLFVFALFHPQPTIYLLPSPPPGLPFHATGLGPFRGFAAAIAGAGGNSFVFPSVVSVTGWICMGGAVAAALYFAVTMVFGKRLALKAFHVVMMSPDEFAPLQEKVMDLAHRIGVPDPRVGLTEDLCPNAFTLGCGRGAVLVFSLGILKVLDDVELEAVVSHELAHIKAQDYLFRTISYSLNLLSFFNPLSYFAASQAQKERELLADEVGSAQLSQPTVMARVLARLGDILQSFPKESLNCRLSASLFLVSPLVRRPAILAAHPQIAHRVSNIKAGNVARQPWTARRKIVAFCLVAVLAATALAIGYAAVQLETSYFHRNHMFIVQNREMGAIALSGLGKADAFFLPSADGQLTVTTGFPAQIPAGNFSTGPVPVMTNSSGVILYLNGSAHVPGFSVVLNRAAVFSSAR